jgi:serine protease inhibitor
MICQRPLRALFSLSMGLSLVSALALGVVGTVGAARAAVGSSADADDKGLGIVDGVAPVKKKAPVGAKKPAVKHTAAGASASSSKTSNSASSTTTSPTSTRPASTTSSTTSTTSTGSTTSSPSDSDAMKMPDGDSSTTTNSAAGSAGNPGAASSVSPSSTSSQTATGDKTDTQGEQTIKSPTPGVLVSGENFFGLSSYKSLAGSESKNIFISPLSLHACLHMMYDGAGGATASDMAKVLGFPKDSEALANDQYVELMSQIHPPDENDQPLFVFSCANSLWANKDVKLKPAFAESSKKVFGAEVANLDFSQPESVDKINSWVGEQTHGKIPKILNQLRPEQSLVAVNAAYFKARWKKVFDKAKTQDADFTTASGAVKVPMMDINGDYNYFENDQFQSIELPYEGGRTSLVVFLPRENSSLAHLRESLSADSWVSWTEKMSLQGGQLDLPRFTMGYEVHCKNFLSDAGMKSAFESQADFSRIVESGSPASLSDVVHKTFVKVDEEGTEAAAATASVERMLAMVVDKGPVPFKMIVNRPFLFAVVNWKTKAILFLGQCVNPNEG